MADEHVCLWPGPDKPHDPHDWWYTSWGGGHQLDGPDDTERNVKQWRCPGVRAGRMFALVTTQGTAIPGTAVCGEHHTTTSGQAIAIGEVDQGDHPDWDGNEEFTDCSGNEELACQVCAPTSLGPVSAWTTWQWDCPCGATNHVDHDPAGENVTCEDCYDTYTVEVVH